MLTASRKQKMSNAYPSELADKAANQQAIFLQHNAKLLAVFDYYFKTKFWSHKLLRARVVKRSKVVPVESPLMTCQYLTGLHPNLCCRQQFQRNFI